ncbi:MAG: hypothetical protein GFH27_549279n233 [Chloroflexi bacterium AL-W]|nr:hypothetical protein [Chloroflexi bacterium AL-N1]NOK65199.1 hypothetical protein [Chloroflexi bacterium AL-N10]NOK72536.1 hypothetical protein [Chloroflexi bacterium AL-N5]NOK79378.1 hypothetical protein [Chloroflexi bacterium AL-W]NOK87294.1 hypothetical protein [Chloroflexi bacterium AL-N15]
MTSQSTAEGASPIEALYNQQKRLSGELKSVREIVSDLAWELEDMEGRLAELQQANQDTYTTQIEMEIRHITINRTHVEEQTIRYMLRVDELTERYREIDRLLQTNSPAQHQCNDSSSGVIDNTPLSHTQD